MQQSSKNIYGLPFPADTVITKISRDSPAHTGPFITAIDIEMIVGTEVRAPLEGEVVTVVDGHIEYGPSRKYGQSVNYVRLKHANDEYSEYLHLGNKSIVVKVGDQVKKGQFLGKTGLSGWMTSPHLHWLVFVYDSSPERFHGLEIQFDKVTEATLFKEK